VNRAERYAQCKALRDQGLLLRQIAERTGLAISTVSDVLQDPSGETARERKRRFERPCVDCGATVNPNGLRDRDVRCLPCEHAFRRTLEHREASSARRAGPWRYTDEEILAAVRAAAVDGRVTVTLYNAHGEGPSVPAIIRRFGKWNTAVAKAGLRTSCRDHKQRSDRWDDDVLLGCVRECADDLGTPFPTHDEYSEWAREQGAPSVTTLRNHFGTWLTVMGLVRERAAA
jgi:transcriptional regulator with XRE-family HTH domain